MKSISEAYIKIIDLINKILKILILILFIGTLVIIFSSIITRYVLKMPMGWVEECAKFLIFFMVFLASPLVAREDRLIRMSFLQELFLAKKNLYKMFDWIATIFSLIFYIYVIIYSLRSVAFSQGQTTLALGLSMSVIYAAIPIGCCLMFLNTLACILEKTFINPNSVEGGGN